MMPLRRLVLAAVLAATSFPFATLAQAPADPAAAAAEPDPDAIFKGRMGGTFGKNVTEVMPAGKRIAVASFRVAFITDNSVSAQVRGSYLPGRDTSGASSSLFVALKGVDAATMQAITERAYAEFMKQLAASGREVVPADQVKEALAGAKATPTSADKPYTKDHNGQTASFFTPAGLPLLFTHFDTQWGDSGMFDLTNLRKLQEVSSKVNAVVIAPVMFVNFAKMRSSGNQSGLVARTAETGAEMAMSVAGFSSLYMRTEEFRNGMLMKGDEGGFQMHGAVTSPKDFGTMQTLAQEDNKGMKSAFDMLGRMAGIANAGGAARSSTKAVAETTNDAYAAAADDALARTAVVFAKWWKKYPPAP